MITPLPNPPLVTDSPTDFQNKASTFLGALPTFAIEANADIAGITNTAATAMWVATTTYSRGNVVWSPITYVNYRLKVTTLTGAAGNADPSADTTNWAQATGTGNVSAGTSPSFTNLTATGNVGIGTSSPRAQTHIFGVGQTTAQLTDAGNRGGMLRVSDNTGLAGSGGAILFATGQSDGANSIGFAAIKGLLVSGSDNTIGDLAFSTRNGTTSTSLSERMRIDSSGNVGIGTSSPSCSLQVNGSVRARGGVPGAGGVNNNGFGFTGNGGDNDSGMYSSEDGQIEFYSNSGEKMRIDASGFAQFSGNNVMPYQGAPTSKAAAATLTGAELITGILNTTGTNYTITLPTGTTIEAALTWSANNVCLDWFVINTASGTITIGANGNTTLGSLTVATGVSAQFRIRRTSTNTFTVYRLG